MWVTSVYVNAFVLYVEWHWRWQLSMAKRHLLYDMGICQFLHLPGIHIWVLILNAILMLNDYIPTYFARSPIRHFCFVDDVLKMFFRFARFRRWFKNCGIVEIYVWNRDYIFRFIIAYFCSQLLYFIIGVYKYIRSIR